MHFCQVIAANRSSRRQMAMNMSTSIIVFVLNLCVSFFLTPFIVSRLGTAAYGFVGLSNNIIGYTGLLTVAVNAMAGRFVTIKVHEGNIRQANIYLSSVFFANMILATVILVGLVVVVVFLPDLINIPSELIVDVRILFSLLALSTCLGLMIGIISVSTFICNRLDYSNLRTLVGTVIRVVLLLLLFGFLPPKLWYIGISVMVMEIYGIITNYWFFCNLTPELQIKRTYFDFKHLKEVVLAGAWNILNKLSEILTRGLDLLMVNLFIGTTAMGQLSLSQTLPILVLGFVGTLTANFAPIFTRLYAQGQFDNLKAELLRSVRLSSFISCIPLTLIFVYSDVFYSLWLPTENAEFLYKLTVYGSIGLIFAMPLEPLWNIFTITNKVRQSSLNLIYFSTCQFVVVLVLMFLTDDNVIRLFLLIGTRVLVNSIRCLTFLPIYGAKCLGFSRILFFSLILKNVFCLFGVIFVSFVYKHFANPCSWITLIGAVGSSIIGVIIISSFIILNKADRRTLLSVVKQKMRFL